MAIQILLPVIPVLVFIWYLISNFLSLTSSYLYLPVQFFFYTLTKIKRLMSRRNELTIVLDLDETLVHTTDTPPQLLEYQYFTVTDCKGRLYYVYKRPHLDHFLRKASELGEVVVFTAAERRYAVQVVANMEVEIRRVYSREVTVVGKVGMCCGLVWSD
eukprot:TRINITY_DN8490_c0_g2_i5.p1 TRINITY_DN8490_c0_g2~~TRINITY_DN8490_c0_g2_i5.p1  ORF type:complete len:159 (+),score=18.87 TRINITY_DN8490_c0_g2_i5:394-870(+)